MYEIGSEFNYIDKEQDARQDLTAMYEGFSDVRFLRCGRDAIGFVCEDIKLENGITGQGGSKTVTDVNFVALLPALCCDSMYRPFEVHGIPVRFYSVNKDLSVDTDSIKAIYDDIKAKDAATKVIVLTAIYYGITDISELDASIKSIDKDIYVIEDVTQGVLAPAYFDKDNADYIIGSIRKWMGVPDGAVAIKNMAGSAFTATFVEGENSFATLRYKALRMKTLYLQNGDQELKKSFRSMLGDAEDSLTDGAEIYEMSAESTEYLKSIPVKNIVSTRNNNYDTLYELLEKSVHNNVYFHLFPKKIAKMPAFMLPVLMDTDRLNESITDKTSNAENCIDRDGFERLLAAKGIYAPVLWPVSDEAAKACPVSKNIADHILCFWIDQRYDRFDMVQTFECFEEVIKELV